MRGAGLVCATCAASAALADGGRCCSTSVAPSANTLVPSTPMATHIHLRPWAPAGAAAKGVVGAVRGSVVRFMVVFLPCCCVSGANDQQAV